MKQSFSPLTLVVGLILGVTLVPLVYLLIRAAGAQQDALAFLFDTRTLAVIGNSLALTVAVVIGATVIGVPFAWLTANSDLPLRRVWLIGGMLALVIPSYIGAIAYAQAFGPTGFLQQALAPFGVKALPPLYGFFGAWLACTLFTFPYIVLPVRAALLKRDPALEECARSLGLSRWATFWRVVLPQLRPALAGGALMAALYTLSDFGAVAVMRYNAFTRVIYSQYTSSFDRESAALLSIVLVVITLALLLFSRRFSNAGRRNYRAGVGVNRRGRVLKLKRWRIPALVFMTLVVGLSAVTPIIVLVSWLFRPARGAVDWAEPLANTVGVSALTALVVALAALPVAWAAVRGRTRAGRWLSQLGYLGNGLPGVVIALAWVFFAANGLPALYQTLPILILGYATRFLPLSVSATQGALTQINPRLEEAGRSLGLSPSAVLLRLTLPLARVGVLAGMALVFVNTMKELPTTLLLSPTGFTTFATQIWTAQSEVNYGAVGVPALLLMFASACSLALVLRDTGRG